MAGQEESLNKGQIEDSEVQTRNRFLNGLKTSITVAGTDMDDSILDFFFPTFILLLRDHHLEVSEGSDQHMENVIKLKRETEDKTLKYNLPRELVRRYFKKRKCFILGFPTTPTKMPELMNMTEDELDDNFKKQLNAFRNYVFSSGPKTLKSGKGINGRMFCTLLECYVNALKTNQAPNIQDAMKTMSDVENTRTINEAAAIYETMMKQKIDANGDQSDSDLDTLHRDCMDAAFSVLKSGLVFDDEQIYEQRAISRIEEHSKRFRSLVEKKLNAICKAKLQQLNERIERKMKIGAYRHYTGYDEYMTDIDWVIGRYYREYKFLPNHGGDTIQEFLDGKESEELVVYQWVVEAQAQEKPRVKTSIPPSKRQPNDLRACDEQIPPKGTDTLEIRLSKSVEYVQASGMKNIANSYLEMIKMKQNELERVKNELSAENPVVKKLHQEIEYWEKFGKSATWNQSKYKHDVPSEEGVSEPYRRKNITVKMAESMKKLEEIYSKKKTFIYKTR